MNMIQKIDFFMFSAKAAIERKVQEFLYDEKGDTNFISILVLLGIGLALAGVFLTFKDSVLDWVDTAIGDFFERDAGRGGSGAPGSSGGGFR